MTATYTISQARPANVSTAFSWVAFVVGVPTLVIAGMSPQEYTVWSGAILTSVSMLVVLGLKLWDQVERRLAKRDQRINRRSGQHRRVRPPREEEL